ncbi:hypothetical protein [Streptomyces sp. NPDC006289]|uniref:hypothetical protein n=1 Tax=unclassified Streptomyces TaxID=2593676 RepID=UPI0033BF1DE6
MDLTESLGKAVAALKAPLGQDDREQGWTDELRRDFQEAISVDRSVLRRYGAVYLARPRLDEALEAEGVRPGRLRDVVLGVQALVVEAFEAARPR